MSGKELAHIEEAFATNYVAPAGPMLEAFESRLAAYTGIPHVVVVSSGTAAMHLALKALPLVRGDEIWASTLTFIGSVGPAIQEGLVPVFIDADSESWTMDTALLAEELRKAAKSGRLPKAVIPTDIYGQSCDLDRICSLCAEYGIPVICDSAEAMGARYKNRHAGDGAFAAVFSFNGNKIITTSGGGALASHDPKVIAHARYLATQARAPVVHYEHSDVGFNYRMSNICAAIGIGQLEVLDERVGLRRRIFELYRERLGGLPGISFMPEAGYGRATRWLSVMLIDESQFGASRESVRLMLEAENIESRPVWKPMHMQPVFQGARHVGGKISEKFFEDGLCLPSGSQMSEEQVDRVAGLIRRAGRSV